MKKDTRAWLAKADEDLRAAQNLAKSNEDFYDTVCFHCQQAGEKYLKAMLCELGMSIPYIHDLTTLAKLLAVPVPEVLRFRKRLSSLSEYAVDCRYPGMDATPTDARSSLRNAVRVQRFCFEWLASRKKPRPKRP